MIQVHLFCNAGHKSNWFQAVQDEANCFFREQAITREELITCQLTEAALLVVVDVEEHITEADIEEALEEAVKLGYVERVP